MRQRAIFGFSRREVINRALTLAAAGLTAPYAGPVSAAPRLCCSPFKLGVASGDPYPDGVVLWTRLALDLEDGEQWGLPERAYTLRWEVRDPTLSGTPLVKHGTAVASADKAYAVHVEVTGLQPSRAYLYRFILGDYFDEGITRTAPARGAMPESLRFAFCSCAEFENAYHYAYKFMADEKPEFIVHLGDYIYEQTYDEHYQRDDKREPKKEKDEEKEKKKKREDPSASRSECSEGGTQVLRMRKLQFDRVGKLRELSQYRRRYAEYKLGPPSCEMPTSNARSS